MPPSTPPEFCLLWINHWATCMQKSEWASWVQAVGSVVAILASASLIWWQVRKQHGLAVGHAHRTQLEEELRLLEGFRGVAAYGSLRLNEAHDMTATSEAADNYEKTQRYAKDFDLTQEALEATDANRMTTPWLILSMSGARKQFSAALSTLDRALRYKGEINNAYRQQSRAELSELIQSLESNLRPLAERAADIRLELNMPLLRWHMEALAMRETFQARSGN